MMTSQPSSATSHAHELAHTHDGMTQDQMKLQVESAMSSDERPSDEQNLSEYDKELADSFPASDPPSQP